MRRRREKPDYALIAALERACGIEGAPTGDEVPDWPRIHRLERELGIAPVIAGHGTQQAYQRHFRNGEEPCAPCREARRAYERALKVPR